MAREIKSYNHYKDRLLKLIPTEIVAAYLVIEGMIPEEGPRAAWVSLVSALVLLILIPFYLRQTMSVRRTGQVVFTMISFVVWVYSFGGPFAFYGLYVGYIGSILLVIWTLLIPLLYKPSTDTDG